MNTTPFQPYPKIARLTRECVVTEKLDGTNAVIHITDDGGFYTGSRNRWIIPGDDNFGFSSWAYANKNDLLKLGPGWHYGEWWGHGIGRGYGCEKGERYFSLFNVGVWNYDNVPSPARVVPTLHRGPFDSVSIDDVLFDLYTRGSYAKRGYMLPEGIIVYHTASQTLYKKTIEKDSEPKGKNV